MRLDVSDFGAVGDGRADDSGAFRRAIAACAQRGGGTVHVPAGRYRVEPLRLCSHLELRLESGAELLITDDFQSFPIVHTRWAGYMCHCLQPCLFGDALENVSITGDGVIDGQGANWWAAYRALKGGEAPGYAFQRRLHALNRDVDTGGAVWDEWARQFLRPALLQFKDCRRVLIDGVTLRNSPFWNTQLLFCEDVTVHNARFENPPDAPNGDGLDVDSSCRVRVSDCSFNVGDDCLCLKSGIDACGRRVGRPTEDVTVTNCTMYRGHGGVVMGSDTAAGIRNVVIGNCIFHGTDRGVRLKSRRGRGGVVEDIRVHDIIMTDVACPVCMNLYYSCGAQGAWAKHVANPAVQPVDETTPVIRRITLNGITARRARAAAGVLIGLPESPIRDVTLRDVRIDTVDTEPPVQAAMSFHCPPTAGAGLMTRHVKGVYLDAVSIIPCRGPALDSGPDDDVQVRR